MESKVSGFRVWCIFKFYRDSCARICPFEFFVLVANPWPGSLSVHLGLNLGLKISTW